MAEPAELGCAEGHGVPILELSYRLGANMRNLILGVSLFAAAAAASAQFASTPSPAAPGAKKVSGAPTAKDYRRDGARHIYAAYGAHIYKGKLPPLLYGIA